MPLFLIVVTTILIFCLIYGPQPLLPLFSQTLALTESEAALLMTATMLPLSLAPLSYGYLLESLSSVTLLRTAVLGLALLEIAFAVTDSFAVFVGLRFLQGLLVPAALTAMMTYIAVAARQPRAGPAGTNSENIAGNRAGGDAATGSPNETGGPDRLQRGMSFYIAATMVGSTSGRLLAGLFAAYLNWRLFFWLIGLLLGGAFFALGSLRDETRFKSTRPTFQALLDTIRRGDHLQIYGAVFCLFFVFAAFFNFLPFRVGELFRPDFG